MNKKLLYLIPLLFLVGCSSTRYAWNGYDAGLYSYYKNPADNEKFIERLEQTILQGEKTKNVPPGIYAEYGYVLYENQKFSDAIIYFKKESDTWPESRVFMEKMINNAQKMVDKK